MLDKVDSYKFKDHAANESLKEEEKVELLRKMVRIRRFEEASLKYYNAGKMGGFLHLYIGQESIAVGTASLCGKNDHLITAYRDHCLLYTSPSPRDQRGSGFASSGC